MKTIRKAVILFTVIGLLAISGLAMADSHVDQNPDGVFNFGTDTGPDDAFLFWNITSLEYDQEFSDIYPACALDSQDPLAYSFEDDVLTLPDYEPDPLCGDFQGGSVTADGHPYNHGAYMSFFNSMYEGTGRGCLNRHLAQSQLGKDPAPDELSGVLSFETAQVDCQHGKDSVDDPAGQGSDTTPPGKAKWGEDKPGKSGDAPGRNK